MLLDGVVIAVWVWLETVELRKGRSLSNKTRECGYFGLGFDYGVCVCARFRDGYDVKEVEMR